MEMYTQMKFRKLLAKLDAACRRRNHKETSCVGLWTMKE